jgi:polyphosphate kinase 2 (PPK2 family)
MDPRYLETHAFGPPSEEEAERPPMWRFWLTLPPKGRIGMFFGSWYSKPILDRVYGHSGKAALEVAIDHIKTFEQGLADDGTLVLKYWFHLKKKTQKKTFKKLSRDPRLAWRVTKLDWKHLDLYDDFLPVCEHVLRDTSTGDAPWTIVEGVERHREVMRAYNEIDEFEQNLDDFGIGIGKFWLHIDQDEQLARFRAREQTSYKEFKITEGDYRNRAKWDLYEAAVNEMVERTSTSFARWTLVEANDKYHARLRVLETVCDVLERTIKQKKKRKR